MKKIALGLMAFLVSLLPAGAILLVSDSFNYPDGPLTAVSGGAWTHHSGSVTGEVSIVSGRVALKESLSEDVNTIVPGQPYPASGPTNVFFAAFTVKFTTLPGLDGTYFAHFKSASGTGFRARVWALTRGAAPDKFRVGISSTSGSVVNATNPTDLGLNTDYTVVVRFMNSNSISTLWINPDSESDLSVSTAEAASAFTVVSYALRESSGEGALTVDDLRIGTAFSDVVSNDPVKPPAISIQPQHQIVTNGDTATLAVDATGTPPLAFQWQFNGSDLPGANSASLVLSNTTFARSGVYTVTVTNSAGSCVSEPAVINVWRAAALAFTLLTYNTHGNGLTNWSTNLWHLQAIGRQMQWLDPDIITFQEIPITNDCTAQMTNFVTAFRPGFYLATNSADDGFIHSAILSRFPILSSTSWLHGADLTPYGCTNAAFTRDLFEAVIAVPGYSEPLHVYTVHLKSAQDKASATKRAAEAAAVSNFFAGLDKPRICTLSGDMNEDIFRPPASDPQSIQRLIGERTDFCLTTPINSVTRTERTWSIQDSNGPTRRYDYILPCTRLFTNIVRSEVFRTDLLNPVPVDLYADDDQIASDHLPVLMAFANPFTDSFRILSIGVTNQILSLRWETLGGIAYSLEGSSNLIDWVPFAENLTAAGDELNFATNAPETTTYFRVRREPSN